MPEHRQPRQARPRREGPSRPQAKHRAPAPARRALSQQAECGSSHRASRSLLRGRRAMTHVLIAPLSVLALTGAAFAVAPVITNPDRPAAAPAASSSAPSSQQSTSSAPIPELPEVAPMAVTPAVGSTLGRYRDYKQSAADLSDDELVAFQRTEGIMVTAAPDCHLSWALVAAVARVDTSVIADHDRPADTDAGQYDDDPRTDRPVGPLHLMPATWTLVAVDGDDDGLRDPEDLDDASLAAAVVLCGDGRDLDRQRSLRRALKAFHPSHRYAAIVTHLAQHYLWSHSVQDDGLETVEIGLPTDTTVPTDPTGPIDPTDPDTDVEEPDGSGSGSAGTQTDEPGGEPSTDPTIPTDPTEPSSDPTSAPGTEPDPGTSGTDETSDETSGETAGETVAGPSSVPTF